MDLAEAIIIATAPAPSTRGFEGALIPAVTIYVFAWSILKGLLQLRFQGR